MNTKYFIAAMLIILVLTTACGTQLNSATGPQTPDIPLKTPEKSELTPVIKETSPIPVVEATLPPVMNETSIPAATSGPDCLGDGTNPIGQSIADEYKSTSYEQVMTWFCNGAEFQDIMVALETEAQTGTSTDEMLKMVADGFTWDEIWQQVGLID